MRRDRRFHPPSRLMAVLACLPAFLLFMPISHAADNPPSPAAPAKEVKFDVHEYRVLGNTVLPSRDIETVLYPLLGDGKQFSDVEAARAALEKAYHSRGYGTVFVDIPAQDIADGIVRLRVTEGRINSRKIDGARYFSERDIAAAIPSAKVGAVPDLQAIQQEIAAANAQTPDRSVVPILKAGPVPGTMDLELKTTDTLPLHGSIELDDNYTAATKPLRESASLSYGNLFAALDAISLQYQDSPQEWGQVSVLNANYLSRPFADGFRISSYFINSNSNVSNVGAGALGVLGKGQIFGLALNLPPFVSTSYSHTLTFGVDYKHFRDVITPGGGSAALVTPISYTNVSFAYTGVWRSPHFESSLNITPDFGLRGAPNDAESFENKRFLGRPNYFYVRWDGSVTALLPGDFRTTFRLAGQDTLEPLISNEDFSIGGSDGVRGYLEAEELGDLALKGTFQFQTPTWSWHIQQLFNAFAFFDAGRSRVLSPLSGQASHVDLASAGVGINLFPGHWYSGTLTWADPLRTATYTKSGQSRWLFMVRGSF
ncbi:MAG: hemolysin activation/secretion protein associated with VreARI signaling system [Gammaproteobacteria bacterium]|nr:hemolysin activation/secretion protein associated with VreARI signaling system [Gammaproteobacteria bacterium]